MVGMNGLFLQSRLQGRGQSPKKCKKISLQDCGTPIVMEQLHYEKELLQANGARITP